MSNNSELWLIADRNTVSEDAFIAYAKKEDVIPNTDRISHLITSDIFHCDDTESKLKKIDRYRSLISDIEERILSEETDLFEPSKAIYRLV